MDVSHDEWDDFIRKGSITLLDVRNDYEIAAGSFKNATTTNIKSFAEVYEWIDDNISHLDKNIIISIYCVHGVRSKIAGKYIKSLGFMNVFHLKGGIAEYMKYIGDMKHSAWQGQVYV